MNFQDAQIGLAVVRSKGDYVVGRTGEIIEIDAIKKRVQVNWHGENKSWCSVEVVEPAYLRYKIIPMQFNAAGRRIEWPKYIKI